MKKKLSAIIATVMILSMGVTAFANNIEARGPSCPECGSGTYYDYRLEKEYPCPRYGKDGCGRYVWGWECSCGSFQKVTEGDYACE